jgi:hypothetical protein
MSVSLQDDSNSTSVTLRRSASNKTTRSPTATHSGPGASSSASHTSAVVAVYHRSPTAVKRPKVTGTEQALASIGVSASQAQAITAAAYGSTTVASLISPTAGNKQVSIARVAGTAQCVLLSQGGGFPIPDAWSLLPAIPGSHHHHPATVAIHRRRQRVWF